MQLLPHVLLYCDERGLIGKEHFATDSCKLPSHAFRHRSRTHEELRHRKQNMGQRMR
jgi:hypothetical protein